MEKPSSNKKIKVCRSQSCDSFGAQRIMKKIEKETGLKTGESNDTMDIDYCGCLGFCHRAPNVAIDEDKIIHEAKVDTIMDKIEEGGEIIDTQDIDIDQILDDGIIKPSHMDKKNDEEIKTPKDLPEEISQGIRKEGNIRRVVVDREACIGARSCVVVAEAAFQMDGENLAYVAEGFDEVDEDTLRLAAEACPVLAIHLYDKEGKKLFPEE